LLYILWGEDEFSIAETLQTIKNSCGDSSLLSTNTTLFDGQKLAVNELKSVVGAMPFLSPRRLVVVRGLLERFEPKDKLSQTRKNIGANGKGDDSKAFAGCMLGLPESTILVLIDTFEIKKYSLKNNPLFNAISPKGDIRSFPLIKGTRLTQWIESRVSQRGGSISHQASSLLIETIGGDLFTMTNEIEKLVAFTAGRLIEEKDVRAVVAASREADIFAMIDAIMDRRAGIAEGILQKLLQNGVVPPQMLVLLARQVQMLVQLKDLKRQKRPAAEIQTKLGIFNPFAWNKMSSRADKYTLDNLKKIYQRLLETDLAIKTGRYDGDLALNILVADLCVS
jgi:DNA polymerase III subunit delta